MSGNLPEELMDVDTEDLFGEEEGEEEVEPEETERVILFELGGEPYAAPVLAVSQVVESSSLTRIPRTAKAIDGVVDLRGDIVAVINPWVHLNVPGEAGDWSDQLLAVFSETEDQQPLGIRIDDVIGVETFPASQVVREVGPKHEGPHTANPVVQGVLRREDGDEVTERIPLLDTVAIVDASGQHPRAGSGARPGR